MSVFRCIKCDKFIDSDVIECHEAPGQPHELICDICYEQEERVNGETRAEFMARKDREYVEENYGFIDKLKKQTKESIQKFHEKQK